LTVPSPKTFSIFKSVKFFDKMRTPNYTGTPLFSYFSISPTRSARCGLPGENLERKVAVRETKKTTRVTRGPSFLIDFLKHNRFRESFI